jgi:hypothetical protein
MYIFGSGLFRKFIWTADHLNIAKKQRRWCAIYSLLLSSCSNAALSVLSPSLSFFPCPSFLRMLARAVGSCLSLRALHAASYSTLFWRPYHWTGDQLKTASASLSTAFQLSAASPLPSQSAACFRENILFIHIHYSLLLPIYHYSEWINSLLLNNKSFWICYHLVKTKRMHFSFKM